MQDIGFTVGDKQLLEEGIESIADELGAAFASCGRRLEVSERFTDSDVHEVTIGPESAIIADWSDDGFDMDCDLPRVGGGTWPCRTHMAVMIRLLRAALGELPDAATWQLCNFDETFTFFIATRDQVETAAKSSKHEAIYDFD